MWHVEEYSDMSSVTLSRAALAVAGRALGLRESILSATGTASRNHVAETVEAVLGAIYVDSNFNVQTVKDVIKTVKLDDHRFLRAKVQVENEVVEKVALHAAGEYQDDNHLKNDLFYRGEPTVQDLSKRSIRIAKRQTIRSEGLEQAPIVNIGYNAEQNHELNNNEQQSQAPQIARAERVCDQDIENVIEDGHQSSASVTLQTHTDAQALHTNNETITSKVQLEIDLLQRLSEERVERSGAATEALHKHAMLLKDGVNVSPLRVFREIRAEIGRAYDKKLRALEKRNRAEGMALQMAMQKAHEEMRAEKKARLAEEKARSELAALAPGDGKKAEKTKVELTKLTTVVLSSKGSPGTSNLMHAKATSPLAFPDPFYAQTTDRDNASEVEGTREALWRSSAQSQTSRPSSPDERLIELAKRYQAPDTKGEELVPHITATRPNADERDGIARTSKQNCQQLEQGIARLYTHAWSSPKSELQAVSQMREEQKPSCVPMRESPRSQDTKPSDWTVKDGANSMIYESEMDLLLGGFMKDENEEAIHLDNSKQTRNLAETTIKTAEGHGATSVIGIAGEGSNQTITTSNLAQTHTVQSIIAMREELKRQTDAQWHIEKTLGTLTRRASRIARRTRLRRTLSEVPERIRSPLSIMEPEIQSLSKPFRQGYTEEDLRPVNIESQVY
jgi:hypothetical protein